MFSSLFIEMLDSGAIEQAFFINSCTSSIGLALNQDAVLLFANKIIASSDKVEALDFSRRSRSSLAKSCSLTIGFRDRFCFFLQLDRTVEFTTRQMILYQVTQ